MKSYITVPSINGDVTLVRDDHEIRPYQIDFYADRTPDIYLPTCLYIVQDFKDDTETSIEHCIIIKTRYNKFIKPISRLNQTSKANDMNSFITMALWLPQQDEQEDSPYLYHTKYLCPFQKTKLWELMTDKRLH